MRISIASRVYQYAVNDGVASIDPFVLYISKREQGSVIQNFRSYIYDSDNAYIQIK